MGNEARLQHQGEDGGGRGISGTQECQVRPSWVGNELRLQHRGGQACGEGGGARYATQALKRHGHLRIADLGTQGRRAPGPRAPIHSIHNPRPPPVYRTLEHCIQYKTLNPRTCTTPRTLHSQNPSPPHLHNRRPLHAHYAPKHGMQVGQQVPAGVGSGVVGQ